jgi:hypothetical protein
MESITSKMPVRFDELRNIAIMISLKLHRVSLKSEAIPTGRENMLVA